MAEKAVLITTNNQDTLAARYFIERWEYDERMPLGYWLVTDFGNEETYELLTQEKFDEVFTIGETLENDFVDVLRK